MNKIEIAKKLTNALSGVLCKNCPLDKICTYLIDGDSNFDCICTEIENEELKKENEENE